MPGTPARAAFKHLTTLPSLLLALAFLALAPGAARGADTPPAGDGLTTDTAYQITSLNDLVWLGYQASSGLDYTHDKYYTQDKYYKLMNDIDASETSGWNDSGTTTATLEGFTPIGSGVNTAFCGTFLGQGHTIRGLTINRPIHCKCRLVWLC